MQGILKVGRDFFVYFDSKMGLVRRMERNDAYKILRLCDCILIDAIKLKKFIDSVHDFLEIPYEGDLDADVICDQDGLSRFTVADVDALFHPDDDYVTVTTLDDSANIDCYCCGDCDNCKVRDVCDRLYDYDDRDDLDDYANIDCCGDCDNCKDRDACDRLDDYNDEYDCGNCDDCEVRDECDYVNNSSPLWDEDNLLGGGVR